MLSRSPPILNVMSFGSLCKNFMNPTLLNIVCVAIVRIILTLYNVVPYCLNCRSLTQVRSVNIILNFVDIIFDHVIELNSVKFGCRNYIGIHTF